MKIRTGFVSNSSSSSFIISIKESKSCKHCGRNDPNILDLIKHDEYGDSETSVEAIGMNAVLNEIKNFYLNDKILEKLKLNIKNEDKEGNKLVYLNISYNDNIIRDLLNNKNIKILFKDNE